MLNSDFLSSYNASNFLQDSNYQPLQDNKYSEKNFYKHLKTFLESPLEFIHKFHKNSPKSLKTDTITSLNNEGFYPPHADDGTKNINENISSYSTGILNTSPEDNPVVKPPMNTDTSFITQAEKYEYLNYIFRLLNSLFNNFTFSSYDISKPPHIKKSYEEYLTRWIENFSQLVEDEKWLKNHKDIYKKQKIIQTIKNEKNIIQEFQEKLERQNYFLKIFGANKWEELILMFSSINIKSPIDNSNSLEKYQPIIQNFVDNLDYFTLYHQLKNKGVGIKNTFKHFSTRKLPADRELITLGNDLQKIVNNVEVFLKFHHLMENYFVFKKNPPTTEVTEYLNTIKQEVSINFNPNNFENIIQQEKIHLLEINKLLCMGLTKEEIKKIIIFNYEDSIKKYIFNLINNTEPLQTLYLNSLEEDTNYKIKQKINSIKVLSDLYKIDIKKYGSLYTEPQREKKKKQMLLEVEKTKSELEEIQKIPPIIREIKKQLLFEKYHRQK